MSQTEYKCFNVTIEDGIAHLQLSRGDALNTMIPDFWRELPEIVNDISDNAKARVIVISSTGKHFCAGMDLSVFAPDPNAKPDRRTRAMTNETFRHTVKKLQDTFSCLDKARVPVLMALQGGVIGGAVDFCSASDIRYCTEDAFFCIQEINIGMTADVGTFPRFCHLVPQGWVRELAYTGRRLPAAKAKEIGLVNEVYATQEELLAAVMATAREIASKSPIAVTGSKVMINYARDHSIDDGLDYIALWQSGMFEPLEMQEAFTAKMEKRDGDFPDLKPLRKTLGQIS